MSTQYYECNETRIIETIVDEKGKSIFVSVLEMEDDEGIYRAYYVTLVSHIAALACFVGVESYVFTNLTIEYSSEKPPEDSKYKKQYLELEDILDNTNWCMADLN